MIELPKTSYQISDEILAKLKAFKKDFGCSSQEKAIELAVSMARAFNALGSRDMSLAERISLLEIEVAAIKKKLKINGE